MNVLCVFLIQRAGGILKARMNAVWGDTRVALHLAAVVPFLPFTPDMMRDVVQLHLEDVGRQAMLKHPHILLLSRIPVVPFTSWRVTPHRFTSSPLSRG